MNARDYLAEITRIDLLTAPESEPARSAVGFLRILVQGNPLSRSFDLFLHEPESHPRLIFFPRRTLSPLRAIGHKLAERRNTVQVSTSRRLRTLPPCGKLS